MRFMKILLLTAVFTVVSVHAQEQFRLAEGTEVNARTLSTNFTEPTAIDIDDNGYAWVADEVTGEIWRMNASGQPTLVGTVELPFTVDDESIRGELFDLVVQQDQGSSGYTVFVLFTNVEGQAVIRSYESDGFSLTSHKDIFVIDEVPINSGYFMSELSDGTLLACVGSYDDTSPSSFNNLNGKLIRFNADGSAPTDNPMYDPNRPTIPMSYVYSYGHRQLAGASEVPSSHASLAGTLFSVEPGAKGSDEINVVDQGRNHGWRHSSGYSATKDPNYVCPAATFNLVPTSVAFYSSDAIPEWNNSLLIGTQAMYGGLIVADVDANGMISNIDAQRPSDDVLVLDETRQFEFTSDTDIERVRDVAVAADGRVYLALAEYGELRRGRVVVLENLKVHTPVSVDEGTTSYQGLTFTFGPNPLQDVLNVQLNEPTDRSWSVRIVDMMGRSVVSTMGNMGSTSVALNTSALASGAYLLIVDNGQATYSAPLTR